MRAGEGGAAAAVTAGVAGPGIGAGRGDSWLTQRVGISIPVWSSRTLANQGWGEDCPVAFTAVLASGGEGGGKGKRVSAVEAGLSAGGGIGVAGRDVGGSGNSGGDSMNCRPKRVIGGLFNLQNLSECTFEGRCGDFHNSIFGICNTRNSARKCTKATRPFRLSGIDVDVPKPEVGG